MIFHELRPLKLVVGQQIKEHTGIDYCISTILKHDAVCNIYPYCSNDKRWWTKRGLYFAEDERAIIHGSIFDIKQLMCNKLRRIYDIP